MLLVALGGFLGAIARFSISQLYSKLTVFPNFIATFCVNGLGSLLLGITLGIGMNDSLTRLLAIGFLGAFTTFSTFSFEAIQLLEKKQFKHACWYIVSSVFIGIGLASFGYFLTY